MSKPKIMDDLPDNPVTLRVTFHDWRCGESGVWWYYDPHKEALHVASIHPPEEDGDGWSGDVHRLESGKVGQCVGNLIESDPYLAIVEARRIIAEDQARLVGHTYSFVPVGEVPA